VILPKKEYATIRFMVYLYDGGTVTQEARGTIAFYDKGNKQRDQITFNHWDEILSGMRKLLRRAGYVKRWQDGYWAFKKK